jgi:hypothetical protein
MTGKAESAKSRAPDQIQTFLASEGPHLGMKTPEQKRLGLLTDLGEKLARLEFNYQSSK